MPPDRDSNAAANQTGPLHRLDARLKLIAALLFVALAVAAPIGSWNRLVALKVSSLLPCRRPLRHLRRATRPDAI